MGRNLDHIGHGLCELASYLPPVKDAIGLKTPGIYRIPCECGTVYIGQSGRSIDLRIKEHDTGFRNVGQLQFDAGEIPRRKYTI